MAYSFRKSAIIAFQNILYAVTLSNNFSPSLTIFVLSPTYAIFLGYSLFLATHLAFSMTCECQLLPALFLHCIQLSLSDFKLKRNFYFHYR